MSIDDNDEVQIEGSSKFPGSLAPLNAALGKGTSTTTSTISNSSTNILSPNTPSFVGGSGTINGTVTPSSASLLAQAALRRQAAAAAEAAKLEAANTSKFTKGPRIEAFSGQGYRVGSLKTDQQTSTSSTATIDSKPQVLTSTSSSIGGMILSSGTEEASPNSSSSSKPRTLNRFEAARVASKSFIGTGNSLR